jgi:hypothetical protein
MTRIRQHLLAEDGTFVVQAIYLGGMIDNTAFDQVYHEHLVYYTLRSLEHLLGLHGGDDGGTGATIDDDVMICCMEKLAGNQDGS